MASAFLTSFISKTSQVLGFVRGRAALTSSSPNPPSSILKDLEKLERTLKRIQMVLQDAEEREIQDAAVKLWLEELRQVAYDAEDVLDEYHYEELHAQVEGPRAFLKGKQVEGDNEEEASGSLSTAIPHVIGDRIKEMREWFDHLPLTFHKRKQVEEGDDKEEVHGGSLPICIPYGISDRISKIGKRFDEIFLDRKRLRLGEGDGERRASGAAYAAQTSHMVDESSIYGREHDKDKIIDLLLSKSTGNGISVIPIVGKGGLGKTTIAQLVYNDSKVKECFDLSGWICVSDDFNVTKLTKDIIQSFRFSVEPRDLTQLSTLQDILYEMVKGKRVLLVLDDVWNEQPSLWESLRIPFVGAGTVRIIVTCRNDSVAEIMQTVVHPYHLGYLSEEQSWLLFKHYAFGGGDSSKETSNMIDIGQQIVKKCSGLPLAVKALGSLLRHMTDEDSWMDVLESDLWELDENNEILAALRLSYSRMPAHLRPCFVYCSMFPKDYVFSKDDTVRLWMAQGYITPRRGRRPEDIGNEYFNDLQRRAFFDSHPSIGGHGIKMHDMVHDLAKSIAGNECYTMVDEKLCNFPDEVRHLYVKAGENLLKLLCSYKLTALRSLLITPQKLGAEAPQFPQPLPMTGCLRALKFDWESINELQISFSNLKHLRYLHIDCTYIERFPESVCLLYHLQSLVIYCDSDFPELPVGLGNLINLRYLKLRGSGNRLPCIPAWIGKLTNLQSLHGKFEVRRGKGQGGMGVLKDFMNLQGSLVISGLRNLVNIEDAGHANLKSKHRLEQLSLIWDELPYFGNAGLNLLVGAEENADIPDDEKIEEAMLEYLQPHTNLKMLSIKGYGGSKFPKWVGNPFCLASLQELHITKCENIRSLSLYIHKSLGKEPLPSLEIVRISGCQQLTSIEGLHDLCLLKTLDICECPQLRLVSNEELPLNLETLHISKCQQLASLFGMQNLHLLKKLNINDCPQLLLVLEEGLPSKLEELRIKGCQQLASLPVLQNLPLLKRLDISCLSQLQLVFKEGLPLEQLYVDSCLQLASLSGLQNLHLLKRLDISHCPQLELVSSEGLPLKLEYLRIKECQQLSLLLGLQNLPLLKRLDISCLPQLQLVFEEGLPSKLEEFHIKGCQQLSLPVLQNLPLLKRLGISCLSQPQLAFEEGLPLLEELYVEDCLQLASLSGLQNLHLLKTLDILHCPQLELVSGEGLPLKLEYLHIKKCQQLSLLLGLQNLTSLIYLHISYCPRLQMMAEDKFSCMPLVVEIVACPGLGDWCQIQKINCIEVQSDSKRIVSNNWVDIKHEFDQMQQCEPQLTFSMSWPSICFLDGKKLEEMVIWSCTSIPIVRWLHELTYLQRLIIKDSPGIQLVQDELLPSTLESLVIDGCENLRSLQLAQQNRDALKELQIVNCPKLTMVEGLNCLSSLKVLRIKLCPELRPSQGDWLPFVPPCIEIAGLLHYDFYPPHFEEVENKEKNR